MSYISDYKCGAIDEDEYRFLAAWENRKARADELEDFYETEEWEEEE